MMKKTAGRTPSEGRWQRLRVALGLLAVLFSLVGVDRAANASPGAADVRFELGMADPRTYDHAVGGGRFGDGLGAQPGDVLAEWQWKHYQCGDLVSFLFAVEATSFTGGDERPRTIDIDLAFDAAASAEPGVGYNDIVDVALNVGDPAMVSNDNSTVDLRSERLSGLYTPGGKLRGTVRVTGVEPGERIVGRVDVRATCSPTIDAAGILYARLDQADGSSGFHEVAPEPRDIGAGENRQQLIQIMKGGLPGTTTSTTAGGSTTSTTGGGSTTSTTGDGSTTSTTGGGSTTSTTGGGSTTSTGPSTSSTGSTTTAPTTTTTSPSTTVTGPTTPTSRPTTTSTTRPSTSTTSATTSTSSPGGPANFVVTKLASPTRVLAPGGDVTFTVAITNTDVGRRLDVSDIVDSDFGDVTQTGGAISTTSCGGLDAINPQVTRSCQFVASVTGLPGDTHVDTVTVSSDRGEVTSGEAVVEIVGSRLGVDKRLGHHEDRDATGTISEGDGLRYEIEVANLGRSPLTGVTVTEERADFDDPACPGGFAGTLAGETSIVCVVDHVVTARDVDAGGITNTATADSEETDPVTDTEVTPLAGYDLALAASVDPASGAEVGDVLTLTVTVRNPGGHHLVDVVLSDELVDLPSPIELLEVGGERTFTGTYTVTEADLMAGKVVFEPTASHPRTGTRSQPLAVPIGGELRLNLFKSADVAAAAVGEDITYTLSVGNAGNATLTGVVVSDPLLGLVGDVGDLAPGESRTFTETYRVTATDGVAGRVDNTATAVSDQVRPDPVTISVRVRGSDGSSPGGGPGAAPFFPSPTTPLVSVLQTPSTDATSTLPFTGVPVSAALWWAAALCAAGAAVITGSRRPDLAARR